MSFIRYLAESCSELLPKSLHTNNAMTQQPYNYRPTGSLAISSLGNVHWMTSPAIMVIFKSVLDNKIFILAVIIFNYCLL